MIKLNNYISEAWSGVKKHTIHQHIIDWCDEMKIQNYTINPQDEIDVNGEVNLRYQKFKELPYKFGTIIGYFDVSRNPNLISLKNCPNEVIGYFACNFCPQLDSLKDCPKKVSGDFSCFECKDLFTEKEVKSLCKVKKDILI